MLPTSGFHIPLCNKTKFTSLYFTICYILLLFRQYHYFALLWKELNSYIVTRFRQVSNQVDRGIIRKLSWKAKRFFNEVLNSTQSTGL